MDEPPADRAASNAANEEPPIRIVDLASLAPGRSASARAESLAVLESACRTSGVFYVRNHGVAPDVIDGLMASTAAFFALPEAERMAIAIRDGESNGYVPLARERGELNDSLSFVGGLGAFDASGTSSPLPRPNDNKWPQRPPGLRDSVEAYIRAMHGVGRTLLSAIAESLDAPPTWFDDLIGPEDAGALRARRYPPQLGSNDVVGTAAHEDGPPLALIAQNHVPGLESFVDGHGFVPLPHVPGTLVCQLGVLFSRITNHRYRPNLHRVVNRDPDRERRSLVFWFPFRPDATLGTIPTCESEEDPSRYPPIRFDAYLCEWIAGLE